MQKAVRRALAVIAATSKSNVAKCVAKWNESNALSKWRSRTESRVERKDVQLQGTNASRCPRNAFTSSMRWKYMLNAEDVGLAKSTTRRIDHLVRWGCHSFHPRSYHHWRHHRHKQEQHRRQLGVEDQQIRRQMLELEGH